MKVKVSIFLEQCRYDEGISPAHEVYVYRVKRVVNTLDVAVGDYLSTYAVNKLIRKGDNVTITK